MKLIAHVIDGHQVDIRPAPVERDWMEATSQRFAYRCLPLNIANAYGWEVLCNASFLAMWTGGGGIDAIVIEPEPGTIAPAVSHFGHGILTFHLPCLFRTEPGAELMVQGPINRPKDGIAALSGIIETDWSPYSFTMNWIFTRPDTPVRFEKGEPYCHIFPMSCGALEGLEPKLEVLSADPEAQAPARCVDGEPRTLQHRPEAAGLGRAVGQMAKALLSRARAGQCADRSGSPPHATPPEAVQEAP